MKIGGLLSGGLILIVITAAIDWLTATTTRLYVNKAKFGPTTSSVKQEFRIHGNRVQPEIVSEGEASFEFQVESRIPHRLILALEPIGRQSYEIFANIHGTRQQIAGGVIEHRTECSVTLPRGSNSLEFDQHGPIRWLNARLIRPVFLWPVYIVCFSMILALAIRRSSLTRLFQQAWLTHATIGILCLIVTEIMLRQFSKKLPSAVISARSDLGAVGVDTRLFDPVRYQVRIQPNLNAHCEWRYGDIVRYGSIPKEVSHAPLHRFLLRTDNEGFRNDKVRAKIDLAALGDSFTDGATGPAEEAWPARLGQLSGLTVQNYGTSGFGPQQELYVLRDFALKHHPRWVILAFFAGNDLHDAELFNHWEQERTIGSEQREGWELPETFRRYETLYLWTLIREGIASSRRLMTNHSESAAVEKTAVPNQATFDRGMFTVPVANHALRYAFLSPYLRQLSRSGPEIESSQGWQLTKQAWREMKQECERNGVRFLLVFIPDKSQVYWPLTERMFSETELQTALDFYSPPGSTRVTVQQIHSNRSALNTLFQRFCAEENIPMLDLTESLQREVEAGHQMYFSDDTHWNPAGHEAAARAIGEFLRR